MSEKTITFQEAFTRGVDAALAALAKETEVADCFADGHSIIVEITGAGTDLGVKLSLAEK
jgi:hypothetical protein